MSTPTTEPDNGSRNRRTLLVVLLGGLIGFLMFMYPMVTARHSDPPQAAAVTPSPTPTAIRPSPSATPAKPTIKPAQPVDNPRCPNVQPAVKLYFTYSKHKESATAFGPSLVPPGLKPGRATATDAQWVTNNFWARLCRDPALDDGTLAGLDPTWDFTGTDTQVLQGIYAAADWSHTRLWYGTVPAGSWSYFMEPAPDHRSKPSIRATRFDTRPSWYLLVRKHDGHEVMFRLECGGQATFPKKDLNLHVH